MLHHFSEFIPIALYEEIRYPNVSISEHLGSEWHNFSRKVIFVEYVMAKKDPVPTRQKSNSSNTYYLHFMLLIAALIYLVTVIHDIKHPFPSLSNISIQCCCGHSTLNTNICYTQLLALIKAYGFLHFL